MPDALLRDWAGGQSLVLPPPGSYAVAMCFLPHDDEARGIAMAHVEHFIRAEGQSLVGWRDVPTDTTGLGARVVETMPWIAPGDRRQRPGDRRPGRLRAQDPDDPQAGAEQRDRALGAAWDAVVARPLHAVLLDPYRRLQGSAASTAAQTFYQDLRNPLTVSALALVHQRFSTNTFPSWRLAHPYRFLCHNGEINTVRGNVNWMAARRQAMTSELLGPDLAKIGAARSGRGNPTPPASTTRSNCW